MVVILLQPLFAHPRLKPSTTLGVRLFDDVDEIAGALGVLDGIEGQPHLVRFGSAELNPFRLVPEPIGLDRTCKHLYFMPPPLDLRAGKNRKVNYKSDRFAGRRSQTAAPWSDRAAKTRAMAKGYS